MEEKLIIELKRLSETMPDEQLQNYLLLRLAHAVEQLATGKLLLRENL